MVSIFCGLAMVPNNSGNLNAFSVSIEIYVPKGWWECWMHPMHVAHVILCMQTLTMLLHFSLG